MTDEDILIWCSRKGVAIYCDLLELHPMYWLKALDTGMFVSSSSCDTCQKVIQDIEHLRRTGSGDVKNIQ
jgi:hypothetical protein